jgi:hypothetical protein
MKFRKSNLYVISRSSVTVYHQTWWRNIFIDGERCLTYLHSDILHHGVKKEFLRKWKNYYRGRYGKWNGDES